MRAKQLVIGGSLLFVVAVLFAVDYGRYLCRNCEMPMDPASVRTFVGVFVNQDVGRWQAYDTFSICNGTECIQYVTPDPGVTWSPASKYKDPQTGYKREGDKIAGGGGGGGESAGSRGEGDYRGNGDREERQERDREGIVEVGEVRGGR